MKVSFGGLTLDGETRELRRGRTVVHLSPKAFDLLTLLVESRPRAVSKAELQERLWPDTFVTESNLAGLVAEIRRAMGDDARTPRFVRTVQRFGYAFTGEVSGGDLNRDKPGAPSGCWLIYGDRQVSLREGENILGREPDTGGFDSITVSRRHARIVIEGERATIEDLGSKNGTYVRGARIDSAEDLKDGDEIGLGSVVVKFRKVATSRSTQTWRHP